MNEEPIFGKMFCVEQPELQIVTPVPEKKRREENPIPPELVDVDPDTFLDEQEEINRRRDNGGQRLN